MAAALALPERLICTFSLTRTSTAGNYVLAACGMSDLSGSWVSRRGEIEGPALIAFPRMRPTHERRALTHAPGGLSMASGGCPCLGGLLPGGYCSGVTRKGHNTRRAAFGGKPRARPTPNAQGRPNPGRHSGGHMPRRATGDPLLKGKDWETVRAHWRARQPCCAVCGRPLNCSIGYRGPDALDVGHVVGRDQAKALGWSRKQINAITNTRPECRSCNRSNGARYVNAKRARSSPRPAPITSGVWG